MEQFAIAEATGNAIPTANAAKKLTEPHGGEKHVKELTVPDVLMHLVGHVEGNSENHDKDDPAPDEDYIVGGTGVVKALQYVLGEKANDMRRSSTPSTPISGNMTPRERPGSSAGLTSAEQRAKAKKMSKSLLDSARKIRVRLQPALVKEANEGDEMAYRRLTFLDQTLQSMIQRFEEEYPETRVAPPPSPNPTASVASSLTERSNPPTELSLNTQATDLVSNPSDDEEAGDGSIKPGIQRHNSGVSLASRALALEEGHIHRLGQHLRRDVLNSPVPSTPPGTQETDDERIRELGERLEAISGVELKEMVARQGWDEALKKVGMGYDDLRRLQEQDPVAWQQFRESQIKARMNVSGGADLPAVS